MRRGLRQPDHQPGACLPQAVRNCSPMRRGLKLRDQTRDLPIFIRSVWKLFPDEKGIETPPPRPVASLFLLVGSCSPMRRGLKRHLKAACNYGYSGWKLFPDEEGIET